MTVLNFGNTVKNNVLVSFNSLLLSISSIWLRFFQHVLSGFTLHQVFNYFFICFKDTGDL